MAKRDARTAYLFDPATGAHTGLDKAWRSPLDVEEAVYHLPANSTLVKPPDVASGQVAVWRDGAWSTAPDLRGTTAYDTTTGAPKIVETIGPLPSSLAPLPRPSAAHVFEGGAWREDLALKAELLAASRAAAIVSVDRRAEVTRLRFITAGDGQALVYAEKRAEADRFLALEQEPQDFTAFPLIEAEVLRTRATARSIAGMWQAKAMAWRRIAAAIETVRFDAHDAIEAAADSEAIELAVDAAAALFVAVGT